MRVIGPSDLLNHKKLALLCSRACPGSIIIHTLDMVRALRETSWAVISGFQSPTEQECLDLLLRAEHAVIICPARSVDGMRVPTAWKPALAAGRILITSRFEKAVRRATAATAEERNRYVLSLADAIFIPHANPGGRLNAVCRETLAAGRTLWTLDDPANAHLLSAGAKPLKSLNDLLE